MEDTCWKKDETPYMIFACKKCDGYLYVKPTQKTKKCLRCGRTHQVKNIETVEMVRGMTEAVNRVKQLQNDLSLKKMGGTPNFCSQNDFKIPCPSFELVNIEQDLKPSKEETLMDNDYSKDFSKLLHKISKTYNKFPEQLIAMLAGEFSIPIDQISFLKNLFLKENYLIKIKNGYFKIISFPK